jgi:hypothetical protein
MGTTMMKMDGRLRLVNFSQLYIHNWQSGRRCQVTYLHTDRSCLMHDNTRKACSQRSKPRMRATEELFKLNFKASKGTLH